jgi:hypothetical protein
MRVLNAAFPLAHRGQLAFNVGAFGLQRLAALGQPVLLGVERGAAPLQVLGAGVDGL